MRNTLIQHFLTWAVAVVLLCVRQPSTSAQTVLVRHIRGTVHGFLELRAPDGSAIASGDVVQVASGSRVTVHVLFQFKDGSIDDETTVFSQHTNFKLISDHHIQKGPSFPHPIDLMIDARSGNVTMRSQDQDGKDQAKTEHMNLPTDLANGMVSAIIENTPSNVPDTNVSLLVATPSLQLIKLDIASRGEEPFSLAGSSRKAIHYQIKVKLEGVSGIIAPIIGKQPPDVQLWALGGPVPTFLKEEGPLYPDGPIDTIQLASPVWPDSQRPGN